MDFPVAEVLDLIEDNEEALGALHLQRFAAVREELLEPEPVVERVIERDVANALWSGSTGDGLLDRVMKQDGLADTAGAHEDYRPLDAAVGHQRGEQREVRPLLELPVEGVHQMRRIPPGILEAEAPNHLFFRYITHCLPTKISALTLVVSGPLGKESASLVPTSYDLENPPPHGASSIRSASTFDDVCDVGPSFIFPEKLPVSSGRWPAVSAIEVTAPKPYWACAEGSA